jgi:type I restriction-modification system DNA methylase subunit
VYEYFLTQFASAEGKNGGQFYTPNCIVRLLVEMLAPYKGRIYDPCCGSGGMFVQSEKFVEAHGGKLGDISIYGQESNATTRRLAVMNLARFLTRNKNDGKRRDRRKQTLFIDARKLGTLIDRVHRELTDADVQRIVSTYHAWRGDQRDAGPNAPAAKYEDVPGFCKSATAAEIVSHGHVLTPGRYVGAEEIEDDGEPFEEKMARLVAELNGQFAESARLEKAIRANLRGLGYGG